ncbi:MAG: hypothetical protein V1644_01620, partial [Candidatus Micrarchaeota archaeon]
IQNHLRKHDGQITGVELQTSLEMLKNHFEKQVEMSAEEKKAFDKFFEMLSYKENGKGKYASLAFLLAAIEFQKINSQALEKTCAIAKDIEKELTPRLWQNHEMFLAPLQKINNACRDSQSFLNPKLARTYEYEIKASTLTENEKKILLEEMQKISGK